MKGTETTFRCEKCEATTRLPAPDWLITDRKFDQKAYPGQMFIRCPRHVTRYAIRRAHRFAQTFYAWENRWEC